MTRKVVSYVRVSTEEQAQHGYSIEVQRQVLDDYAKGHDLDIVCEFVESESAFKPGRPKYKQMVDYLKDHRLVSAVLCYKIDRLSRNMSDYAYLVEQVGVEIVSATEQFPSNASGRLMGDMHAAFSRYSSAQLSERVKPAMEAKARKGIYPSYAPIGYLNDPTTRTLVVDPERAPLIRELFETYAHTDVSLRELAGWATESGLRGRKGAVLHKSAIHKILTNPIYCGLVRWAGITAQGIHQPLVSSYVFDKVQDKLHGRGRPGSRHVFAFRGLLTCGYCGCAITASQIKGRYIYYHCTHGRGKCKQPYIRQETLATKLSSIVDNVQIPQDVATTLIQEIHQGEDERRANLKTKLQQLEKQAKEIELRRDRAYVDRLDGVLTEARWKKLDDQWASQAEALTKEIAHLKNAIQTTAKDDAEEVFELLKRASELYFEQPPEEQAEALKILVSNCLLKGEKVEPVYRKPFDLVVEGVKTGNWYAWRDLNWTTWRHDNPGMLLILAAFWEWRTVFELFRLD